MTNKSSTQLPLSLSLSYTHTHTRKPNQIIILNRTYNTQCTNQGGGIPGPGLGQRLRGVGRPGSPRQQRRQRRRRYYSPRLVASAAGFDGFLIPVLVNGRRPRAGGSLSRHVDRGAAAVRARRGGGGPGMQDGTVQ